STSEVYGTAQRVPIAEDHPLEPQSPYAASKVAADKLMDAWHRTYELPVCILRPFNTYGPGQSARAVIPTIIAQALTGPVRLGSLRPRRDFTFVSDTVAGFLAAAPVAGFVPAAEPPAAVARTIQLGTGDDVAVGDIVKLVGDLLGRELTTDLDPDRVRPANSEVERLISDPALAAELTGWRPEVDLREGVSRTLEWISS